MSDGERASIWIYGLVCVCVCDMIQCTGSAVRRYITAHSPCSPSRVIRQSVRLGHCADASSGANRQPHGEVGRRAQAEREG